MISRPKTARTRSDSAWFRTFATCLLLVASWSFAACESEQVDPTIALFQMPGLSEQDLYALPYPNDLRLRPDGTIDLAKLGKDQPGLIQRYLDLVSTNRSGGFAANGAAYFRFSQSIVEASLPQTPDDARKPGASVFWVDITKGSPTYGQRLPLRFEFRETAGRYAGKNLLATLPVPGFVLEADTTYAVVVTDSLLDKYDISVQADRDFALIMADAAPEARLVRAHTIYAPLRAYIKAQNLTGVVSAAVFRTGKPTGLVAAARKVVQALPPPAAADLVVAKQGSTFSELRGTYQAPNFQRGTPPYMQVEQGGTIELNVAGEPIVSRTETLRFALSVPLGPMPAKGWPIVLYAHGTGGSYRTFLTNGVARTLAEIKDDKGQVLERMAVIGIDQVLHGNRAPKGTNVELAFFNFINPAASVDNVLQGGIDNFQLLRLVKGLTFGKVPWIPSAGRTDDVDFGQAKFDPDRIYFMGHSQGGLTGPSFLAAEPEIKGAVLSGAGGGAALSLLYKTEPVNIAALLDAALKEPLSELHPVLNLIQQMLEPADPNNYAPMFYRQPAAGLSPKHIFLSEGFVDHYTPNQTTESLAIAMGAPLLGTVQGGVAGLTLRGLSAGNLPVSGNVAVAGGTVTAGLLQYLAYSTGKNCTKDDQCGGRACYQGACRREGHFVIFDNQEARRQYSTFLGTLAHNGIPTIAP